MKTLVKLNRGLLGGGRKFTYVLRYQDENGKPLVIQTEERPKSLRQRLVHFGADAL